MKIRKKRGDGADVKRKTRHRVNGVGPDVALERGTQKEPLTIIQIGK